MQKRRYRICVNIISGKFWISLLFLKRIGRHLYYKTLLNGKKHKEKLYYVMKYLGELIGSKDENGNIVPPKEITLKILIEHCTLSAAHLFVRKRDITNK